MNRNPYAKKVCSDEKVQDTVFRMLAEKPCTKTQMYRKTHAIGPQLDEALLILAELDLVRYRIARSTIGKKPFAIYWLRDAKYSPDAW